LSIDFLNARGITFGAHRWAAALGRTTHFQAGDNTSAKSHHKISDGVQFRACMEIAVLKYKPASQETHGLVDNFFPGAHSLRSASWIIIGYKPSKTLNQVLDAIVRSQLAK
jgi:hypothetical protein